MARGDPDAERPRRGEHPDPRCASPSAPTLTATRPGAPGVSSPYAGNAQATAPQDPPPRRADGAGARASGRRGGRELDLARPPADAVRGARGGGVGAADRVEHR